MGLANAGRAINEQGIIDLAGIVGNGNGRAVGETVGRANHEIFKGELGIEIHGGGNVVLFLVGFHLRVAKDDDLGIGIKDFLQGVFNDLDIAPTDHFHPEFRGGIENELFLIQFDNFSVIKGIGYDDRTQRSFQMPQDLSPDIGGCVHNRGSFHGTCFLSFLTK